MGENRSLDDFFDAGADVSVDTDGDAKNTDSADRAGEDSEGSHEDSADNSTDPTGSIAVYRFSGDPTECPGCETSVTALWRDGDRYVCRSCKEW